MPRHLEPPTPQTGLRDQQLHPERGLPPDGRGPRGPRGQHSRHGWPVHVEIQVDGHVDDAVTQAAAAALVDELQDCSAAAFGGRGFVTLLCAPPEEARPAGPRSEADVVQAALQVVSRFAPVRRIHPLEDVEG
ncbi:hypothetical protein [Aquipuribacter hungaricus]|uniref:Uncharacterized protein n=1 Tax=Aquipuribacter hungaricus TaxID=545624 RepID=A0ABV7WDN1_9MICO